ncbi:MAG: hypothetical protein KJ626_11490 [Verrucomicrobia bacterium]|nr:hypothetical protein [Verrucomicrobiota bacterium]
MKFHTENSNGESLTLPLMFGHFVPWFTITADGFPLHPDDEVKLDWKAPIEDMRHWNDSRAGYKRTHHHVPEIGIYDSRNPDIIEWQIRTALDYGVQGFIINWYGKYSVENVITLHWLRGLKKWNTENPDHPFYYFISFDSQAQWPTEGKKPQSLLEDLTFVREHLITDVYLLRDGRPVFSIFPYGDNCRAFREALDEVFGVGGADLLWSGDPQGKGEDACYAWVQPDRETVDLDSPYCWSDPDNCGLDYLRGIYRKANAENSECSYIMHGVWPGFNNQLVVWAWANDPGSPHIRPGVICRETSVGNTLDLTWQVYLDYLRKWADGDPSACVPAPLIQLVTWNDYAETTTLEPTRDYGRTPLAVCRDKLTEARALWEKFSVRH